MKSLNRFQIWANLHFNEMKTIEEILQMYPARGKSDMKALVEKFNLTYDQELEVFKVTNVVSLKC